MSDRHPLDDAIDRAVRDMTHVAADDDAVARVLTRLRETDARDARDVDDARAFKGTRWTLTQRVAWCGVMVFLLMALMNLQSLRRFHREAPDTPRVAVTAPPQASTPSLPPLTAREFPTPVAAAPSIPQATTAGLTVTAASVANDAADASERRAQRALVPLESDIEIASITPVPLGDAQSIHVEPMTTSSLTVDALPVPSIDMPPVSPDQQK
jgi:hypothetical protein